MSLKPYPNSTKQGDSIPYEVARPLGCFFLNISSEEWSVINQLPEAPIIAVSCEQTIIGVFSTSGTPPTIPENTYIENGVIFNPGTTVIEVPLLRRLWLYNTGASSIVSVQLLASWNLLSTDVQPTRI